jgi:hypothetical protein
MLCEKKKYKLTINHHDDIDLNEVNREILFEILYFHIKMRISMYDDNSKITYVVLGSK